MESRNSVMLESCGDDTTLIETVKRIVTREGRDESEIEEDFFLMSQDQGEHCPKTSVEETAHDKTEETFAWTRLCRICASSSDHVIPIFEGEGAEHDLSSKILKYLPIHISASDTLPLQLCYHCANTVLAWHELMEGCLSAERKLLEMQDTLRNKNQYYSPTPLDNLEVPTSVLTTTATIVSDAVDSQSDQQIDYKNGIHNTEEIKSNSSGNHIIQNWITRYYYRKSYKIPVVNLGKRIDPIQTETSNTTGENPKRISFLADNITNDKPIEHSPDTNISFKVRLSYNSTGDEKENKSTKDEDFNLAKQARVNRTKGTKNTQYVQERRTDDTVRSNACLKKDGRSEKKSKHKIIACAICDKKCYSSKRYWAHVRVHSAEKSYTCHICGKQFVQGGSLYYHLKHVHDGVKNHACDICGRSFAMKSAMEDHRRIHTGERPFVCDTCGKTFKTKAALYIHSKTHTNDFPHKCSYCAKGFRWRQTMLAHLTMHTGEKNHTCDVCGRAFGVKNDLTRHKRIHSNEKPYTCKGCGMNFGQKRYLKSHERLKSGMCGSRNSKQIESDCHDPTISSNSSQIQISSGNSEILSI